MVDWQTLLRRIALVLGFLMVFMLVFAIGFRREAKRHFSEGQTAEQRGETELAVALYDRAIRNHYPFSAVRGLARDRLLAIGQDYESAGQSDQARDVYQALLSALSAVETGFSGEGALIRRLEDKVDSLTPPLSSVLIRNQDPASSPSLQTGS